VKIEVHFGGLSLKGVTVQLHANPCAVHFSLRLPCLIQHGIRLYKVDRCIPGCFWLVADLSAVIRIQLLRLHGSMLETMAIGISVFVPCKGTDATRVQAIAAIGCEV
jgi:hypothetical protein